MSARGIFAVVAVLAVFGLLAYGLLSKGSTTLAIGEPAPDKVLPNLDGQGTGDIAEFRGDWVLVNFWASWCGPCRKEAPALEAFQQSEAGKHFTVLGIDLDDESEQARSFAAQYGLTYPQLREGDGRERRDAYGITGFPENFLVNPQGRLALIQRGPVDGAFLRDHIAPLIGRR